jgi:hypothetical protein
MTSTQKYCLSKFFEFAFSFYCRKVMVQGAGRHVKCTLFLVLTSHRFSVWKRRIPLLHSIKWFSCEMGSPIRCVGACALRAQWTSTSALRTSSIANWRISCSAIVLPHIILNDRISPEEISATFREVSVENHSDRLPAEGMQCSSENTSKRRHCHIATFTNPLCIHATLVAFGGK